MLHPKTTKSLPYFQYRHLQEGCIRLVAIETVKDASELSDQLEISLLTFPLSSCPTYTALSYTWDNPSPSIDPCTIVFTKVLRCYPVLCQNRIILASRNLRDALRRIRQFQTWRCNREEMFAHYDEPEKAAFLDNTYGKPEYFWIDALCIDQDDLDERSRQVSLMKKIYQQAQHTIVWLGESDEHTEAAQSFLGKVALNAGVTVSTSMENVPSPHKQVQRYWGVKYLDPDEQIAFFAIMSRNWFFRTWVLQESVLSTRLGVLLGDLCFNFQLLLHAAHVECVNGQDLSFAKTVFAAAKNYPGVASTILSQRTMNSVAKLVFTGKCQEQIANGNLPDFLSVIASSCSLIASDPRDKMYALLGILSEFQRPGVSMTVPDYSKTVEQIFVETTYSVMQARKDLAVLSLSGPNTVTKNLPSWCPDYSSDLHALRVMGDVGSTWLLGPTWTDPPKFELLSDMKLRVEGARIDVVVESTCIGAGSGHTEKTKDLDRLGFGIAQMCALASRLVLPENNHDLSAPQSRVQILWRTIVLDELQGVSPVSAEYGALFPRFIRWMLKAILSIHLKGTSTERAGSLDETELYLYVEKLISHLETLVALEPLDATLVADSAELRAIFSAHIAGQDDNTRDGDATESFISTLASRGLREQPAGASSERVFEETFVSAYMPLMQATMARLDRFTLAMTQAPVLPLDEVWVLHGTYAPCFVRPTSHGRYQYLGTAYVHGIMHGEAAASYGPLTSIILE